MSDTDKKEFLPILKELLENPAVVEELEKQGKVFDPTAFMLLMSDKLMMWDWRKSE